MFQYSRCDRHLGTMKAGLISEISVVSLYIFSDIFFFFNAAKCQIRLFTNKKKSLIRF